ncbi:tetratricopeptide repeat protein [Segetibacter sp. 3557_3]|uniref:tetratricopeptide repeat-containing sensor histidine kinase n=1 Tax=Segetibacter sp. 3557_3 TaxID=2547429 RepID=UPI00105908BE|nr:tetratricopeptide repeat-containing sensor histidine kinase [Segetibacter sp. 3557_3]TDH19826.1 tetratricopeptide repeat protein [Segetibacter sp. 3557_3]
MKNLVTTIWCCLTVMLSWSCDNATNGGSDKDKSVIRLVDSLNEVAFTTKRFNLDSSFAILSKSYNLATSHNYQKGLAIHFLYRAGIYQQNGFDKKALNDYYKSLEISQAIGDTFNMARANHQIANALLGAGKVTEAELVFKQAMADYLKYGKTEEVVNTKNSLGGIKLAQKHYDTARIFFTQALQDSRRADYPYGIKKSLYNLGLLSSQTGDNVMAIKYIDSSLVLDQEIPDQYGLALGNIKLSSIALEQKRYDDAIRYGGLAYEHAGLISATKLQEEAISKLLEAFKEKNQTADILKWQSELIEIQRKVAEQEKSYALNFIEKLTAQQETQLRIEKAYEQSKWQKNFLATVVVAMMILSLLAYLWFKNYKRAESYSLELADKNLQIEKSSLSLDLLNKAISKQNQRLEESNMMKDKLLSIISHDLRHPLVNTKGILELVNLNLVNPEETKQLLGQLESQYVRSLTLLDNLLFWIRGQMKGEEIDKVRINLRQLMEDLIEDHRIPLQNKRIQTINEVQPDLSVYGDKEMLKIIFRNLLSNAIKFTPQEGDIRIYSSNDGSPVIHIKDSGVGMNEEVLQKVKAKQYFTTRGTGNEAGSGFGLMLCRDLIEKHQGTLTIKSEPGRGSTFSVQLPPGSPESNKAA